MPQPNIPFQRQLTTEDISKARASIAPLQQALHDCRERLGSDCLMVAWMSDLHVHAPQPYPGKIGFYADQVDCSANLRLAMAELSALTPLPDLLVLGGDLADSGCGGEAPSHEYAELGRVLREAVPASLPTLAISGNHDHANKPLSSSWHEAWHAAASNAWPPSSDKDDYYFVQHLNGWRFIGLDSRQDHSLSDRQRNWLASELTRDAITPTLVLVHRPLLTVGNWVDDHRLKDRDTFDLLDGSKAVKAIWSGHTHKHRAWRYRGKKHVVFPSLAYGIPGPCGWGVGVFSKNRLAALFIKPMAGPSFDGVASTFKPSGPQLQRMSFKSYTADPLFNPCMLPRESEAR